MNHPRNNVNFDISNTTKREFRMIEYRHYDIKERIVAPVGGLREVENNG